ncbi:MULTISPECIES: hypothetical protein [Corynebacterium]|jgi:hypothetical protein|uniref:hypothetical protein n=1 Tax=Corynebacterium TaxID=1716 RepID=UPI000AE50A86|nr:MULTISPECIES: hypothetical protein [Corynebacterium]MCI1255886.1 hypothetical protein [Corynebacterium provencense]
MTKRVPAAVILAVVVPLPLILSGCSGDGSGGDVVTVTATAPASSPVSSTSTGPSPTLGEPAGAPRQNPDVPEIVEQPEVMDTPEDVPGDVPARDGEDSAGYGSVPPGPQLGDACIGADIGVRSVAADGTGIICDNYSWQVDNGQTPTHPWVDGQIEWSNCIAEKTVEECRDELN